MENIINIKCKGYEVINCNNPVIYKKLNYCKDCYNKYYYMYLKDSTDKERYKILKKKKYIKYRNELIREALLASVNKV